MNVKKFHILIPLLSVGIMFVILFVAMNGQAAGVSLSTAENEPEYSAPLDWGGPDYFGYTYLDSNEPDGPSAVFEDISGLGITVTFNLTNSYIPVDLPFDFPIYGETVTQTYLYGDCLDCYNGFTHLAFGNPYSDPEGYIYWMDWIDRESGSVYTYFDDFSDPKRFIVQYDQVLNYVSDITTTSQIILYENGDILVRYDQDFDWWQLYFDEGGIPYLSDGFVDLPYSDSPKSELAVQYYYPEWYSYLPLIFK
jgi:hypothetical protein